MHFKVYKENTIQSDQHNHLLSFRIYDREGNGYITTDVLKEILKEIDPGLTNDDLDNIIEEVDEDGSGTLDFDGEHSFGVFTVTKNQLHVTGRSVCSNRAETRE